MVNPYGRQRYQIDLRPEAVDGIVFWTRNAGPFLEGFDAVAGHGHPFVVSYTLTGYPRALDRATIEPERAIAHMRDLTRRFGRRAVVWRYDPIVYSSLTPPEWHRDTFAGLAGQLAGVVDEVVVSFAHIYRKSARNMTDAAGRFGFEWHDPPAPEKQALLADLAAIAEAEGLTISLCAQPELWVPGVREAACIDATRLSDVAGRPIEARRKPHRPECACWASRDIGDYDTCPHGCVYCYAVRSRALAKRRHAAHDPDSPYLFNPD